MRSLRKLCAALLSGVLLLPPAGPAWATNVHVKTAAVKTGPAQAWAGFFSGDRGAPLLESLGLSSHPGHLQPLVRVLGRISLEPEKLRSGSVEEHAALIRGLVEDLAGRALQKGYGPVDASQEVAAHEKTRAELGDLVRLPSLLSPARHQSIRDEHAQVTHILYVAKLSRAMSRLEEARKAWGSSWPTEPSQWGELHAAAAEAELPSTLREGLLTTLEDKQEALRTALESDYLSALQRPIVKSLFRRHLAHYGQAQRKLAGSADALEHALSAMTTGAPVSAEARNLLEGLRAYVPGLNPDSAVVGHSVFDLHHASGWAAETGPEEGSSETSGFIAVSSKGSPLWRLHVMIHEGFHQGDKGYGSGRMALALLLADQPAAVMLHTALIEGYTEWRTRKTLLRLLEEGWRGDDPFAVQVVTLAKRELRVSSLLEAKEALRRRWEGEHYTPYVRLVETLMDELGGADALEGFVARGDLAALGTALGPERLKLLGSLAHLKGSGYDAGPLPLEDGYLLRSTPVNALLGRRMESVVRGELTSQKQVDAVGAALWFFVNQASALVEGKSGTEKARYFDAFLAGLDLETDDHDRIFTGLLAARERVPRRFWTRRSLRTVFLAALTAALGAALPHSGLQPSAGALSPTTMSFVSLPIAWLYFHLLEAWLIGRRPEQNLPKLLNTVRKIPGQD